MRRIVGMVTLLALGAAGCGGQEEPVAVPVVEAVALPPEPVEDVATSVPVDPSEPTEPVAVPSPSPSPTVTATPTPEGPTATDAAAFIAATTIDGGTKIEHVVVDADGDGFDEVVSTAIVDGAGYVRVAWWDGETFGVTDDGAGGPGSVVERLQVADVNRDGRVELLLYVRGGGRSSMSVWAVPRRGKVQPLEAVGGCHDRSHVYGVIGARLQAAGEGPPLIVATCDDSPLPMADWSEQRWAWRDGAYRLKVDVIVAPTAKPSPEPTPVEPTDPPASPSPTPGPTPSVASS